MKIIIKKNIMVIYFVLGIIFSSAIITGLIRDLLTINLENSIIPPYTIVLSFLLIFIIPLYPIYLVNNKEFSGITIRSLLSVILFIFFTLIRAISIGFEKVLPFLFILIPPIVVALFLQLLIKNKILFKTLTIFLKFFSFYLIINIIVWAAFLVPKLGTVSGLSFPRMGGTLAPTVLLGYTISMLFPLILRLYGRKSLSKKTVFLILLYLFASFFTGSRGSLWLILLTLGLWIIKKGDNIKFILVIIPILIISIMFIISNFEVERFLMFGDSSRTESWRVGIDYWQSSSLFNKFFGSGLGNIYPHQEWLLNGSQTWNNTFILGNQYSIVHPHNAFVWILVEAGLIGLILFFWPLWEIIVLIIISLLNEMEIKNNEEILLTITIFLLATILSSGIIHTPNVAVIWWFILFTVYRLWFLQKDEAINIDDNINLN